MSVRLMMRAFALDLPPELKLVVLALASYADDDGGNVFPSVESLAARCSMSPRTMKRWLARLRAMGTIQTIAKGGGIVKGAGTGRATLYRLDLDRAETVSPLTPFQPSGTVSPVVENGVTTDTPLVIDTYERRTTPPPSRAKGRRSNGTNPRATGTNPRARDASPRQQRQAEKRGGAETIGAILAGLASRTTGPGAIDEPAADDDAQVADGPFLDGDAVPIGATR